MPTAASYAGSTARRCPSSPGVTPTAGGLVFAGELTGDAIALDAKTGAVLWRQPTRNAIGGGVITYRAGGKAVDRRRRRLQVSRLAGASGVESDHRVRTSVTVKLNARLYHS
jgi:outer membrane protein assembly factor BamB